MLHQLNFEHYSRSSLTKSPLTCTKITFLWNFSPQSLFELNIFINDWNILMTSFNTFERNPYSKVITQRLLSSTESAYMIWEKKLLLLSNRDMWNSRKDINLFHNVSIRIFCFSSFCKRFFLSCETVFRILEVKSVSSC